MSARTVCTCTAIAALMAGHVVSLAVLPNASPTPHPASGRTVPYPFSPQLSDGPIYITPQETWILAACFGTAMLCFLIWLGLSVREWTDRERAEGE